MTCKIKINVKGIEIDYEGNEEYLKTDLPNLIDQIFSVAPNVTVEDNEIAEELPESTNVQSKKLEATTNTIASKLNVKSGNELILAACAHMTFVKGRETFQRTNILAEIKLASNFFKQTYSNNMSVYLKNLVKDGKLIERSQDTYALDSNTLKDLGSKLGVNGN